MNSIIYKKYTLLKPNNYIWKSIWAIKDNNNRNKYVDSLLIHYIDNEFIDLYYKDNISIGMPNKKNEVYYDIYFNIYSLDFNIILYHTVDNIKSYSNIIYQNCQPEEIFLNLMKTPIIKNTRLLNTILKRLQYYKNKWYFYLHYLIKKITYNNNLYNMDYHILNYLMVYK